jgi:hypothetical protein
MTQDINKTQSIDRIRREYIESISYRAMDRTLQMAVDADLLNDRVIKTIEGKYCRKLSAKCHYSGQRMFGRKCITVVTDTSGLSGFRTGTKTFYFHPRQYLLWQLTRYS